MHVPTPLRSVLLPAGLVAGLSTTAPAANADPAVYVIDPEHVVAAFTIMHAGYARVLGHFEEVTGQFVYDDETRELSDVTVTIETASVNTFLEKRDNHVRSADFLDAGAHPQITFVAQGGTPTSNTTGTVTGDLTIRGVTRPVTLDLTLNLLADYPCCHGKETIGVSGTTAILRSDFGSTYALPVFVGDEVEIMLEFEAIREDG
jgi:polyisoprenoid-binding protein YceI